jgi:hypothetical protein
MRRALAAGAIGPLSVGFVCAGCLSLSTGADAGTGSGTGSVAATGTSASSAMATGTNCGTDPTGQALLCEQIDLCPGVEVDPGVFPNCGFRLDGASPLDIECVCGDSLCPVGAPQTCAEVTQLLGGQSGLVVCEQVAEGRCVALGPVDAGTQSSCTPACQTECAGEPGCLSLCGC